MASEPDREPVAIHLSSEPGASQADIDGILDRINRWNMAVTGIRDYRQVAIFLRDDAGAIRGGVTGGVWGGWLHVVALWVDEPLRGLGLGRRLLEAAEAEGRAAGAHGAFLETHTFQAPGLYRRLGYETIAELEDYPPGQSQLIMRKRIGASRMSFDVEADAYDRYMGRWSSQLAPQLADLAGVRAGQRALDVGCGPGALAEVLVARLGAPSVAAVDPSPSFVAAARGRVPGIDVRQAAAEQLPFDDRTFDATLASLVVHFMRDPVAGLAEMARVTRHGGVVATCVWDFAGGRGPLGPFWEAARELDPAAVDESLLAGTRRGHLVELFVAAGLREVDETTLTAERAYAGFDDWWEPFTRGVGPGGAYLAGLGGAQRDALQARCRALLPDGPFVLTAHAWAARGRT